MTAQRICLLAASAAILTLSSCSSNSLPTALPPANASGTASATLPLRATVDFGVVVQGESTNLNCWIKNQGKDALEVSSIQSTCECLEIRLSEMQIAPGKRTLARLHYDGAKEADFIGFLQIEVALINNKGVKVGQIEVPIEVIRHQ